MIANADKDGTGTLDLIEFLQMMKEKIREQNKEEEIGEAFRVFDIVSLEWAMIWLDLNILNFQDRNGYIDRRELGLMMKFMGEPVTQEEIDVGHDDNLCQVTLRMTLFQDILDEADKDQNGLIDYKEFFDMMEPGRS